MATVPPDSVEATLTVAPAEPVPENRETLSELLHTVLPPLPRLVRVLSSTLPRKVIQTNSPCASEGVSLEQAHIAHTSINKSETFIDKLIIVVFTRWTGLEELLRQRLKPQHFRKGRGIWHQNVLLHIISK